MEHPSQTDLLQEIQEEMNYVDPVSRGVRFANYLIDQIVLMVLINSEKYFLGLVNTAETLNDNLIVRDEIIATLWGLFWSIGITLAYYTIFEAASKGRTLGKLLTGTVAITQDGTPFTFKHALLRTLCRFIPFEPLSAFGYQPWHDSITKTAVVRKTW